MMKRLLLILLLIASLLLTACGGGEEPTPPTDGEGDGGDTDGKVTIYGEDKRAVIITNYNRADKNISAMVNLILDKTGERPALFTESFEVQSGEIVIGDTSREITEKAKAKLARRLEREARDSKDYPDYESALRDLVGYAVYSEGGSVAVVWSDVHIAEIAMSYFKEGYLGGSELRLEEGHLGFGALSLDGLLEERANSLREGAWAKLRSAIGEEYGDGVIDSMKRLYTIYKPEAVEWLANLYDPGVGGFYYSNSARNTEGFLPDIESTYGALMFIEASGMAEMYGNDFTKALPREMLEDIGEWIYSLQDADGYFYHPQWPKSFIYERGLQSRITRDLGSAKTVLRRLGLEMKYPSAVVMTDSLVGRGSITVMASRAVMSAAILEQFESTEAFRAYIEKLDAEVLAISDPDARAGRLYAIGNEFQSTVSRVKENPEFVEILHTFFDKHQDPKSGTWSTVLTFNATNSLHKIGYVYNSLGLEFKYMTEMIDTVIAILSKDVETDPIQSGVEFANAWASIEHIYTNIKNCSADKAAAEARLSEVRSYIYANITRAIDATYSQLAGFLQSDSSFGYTRYGSSYTSQGCPAAVAGSAEGDVNGHACISTTITKYIADALGYPELEVKMYSEREMVRFLRVIEGLGPVVKDKESLFSDEVYGFEDGVIPEIFSLTFSAGNEATEGASVTVEEKDGRSALHVIAVDRKGVTGRQNHSINIPIVLTDSTANAAVIEFDLFVNDKGSDSHVKMIEWGIRGGGSLILYPTIGRTSDGRILLYDHEKNPIAELGKVGEWIDFRFEYFWMDGEYKVYVGDKLVGSGSSLYSASLKGTAVTEMTLYTPTSLHADYYIDNLRSSRVNLQNKPSEAVGAALIINPNEVNENEN